MKRVPSGPSNRLGVATLAAYERDRLGFLRKCAEIYGPIVRFTEKVYILNRADLVGVALTHTNREFMSSANFLRERVDGRAGSPELARWMEARAAAHHGLSKAAVASHLMRTFDAVESHVMAWTEHDAVVEIGQLEELTSWLIADYCFSGEGDAVPGRAAAMLDALSPIVSSPFKFPRQLPIPRNIRVTRRLASLELVVNAIVDQRRKSRAQKLDDSSDVDLLDVLIAADFDDHTVCQTLISTLLAAHGVPAAALAWILVLLHANPEFLTRVRSEVDHAADLSEAVASRQLALTEAVVKEALRLYPPTWLAEREIASKVELYGYTLEPGQYVIFSSYVIHRDPNVYADPDTFRPDRWLEPCASTIPRFGFMPFGGGPRVCLGYNFAKAELLLLTALITSRLTFSLVGEQIVPDCRRTLLPKNFALQLAARA